MGNKYNDIKLVYTCPAACPADIFVDRLYTLQESDSAFVLTDGNYTKKFNKDELWYIKMLFSPKETTWESIEKVEKTELTKTANMILRK